MRTPLLAASLVAGSLVAGSLVAGSLVAGSLTSAPLMAQAATSTSGGARGRVLPVSVQITSATAAAPAELRDGATVLGYTREGRLTTLRPGTGELVCLASNPAADQFHVACYHRSLEAFMARGRELRAKGVTGAAVDSARNAEIAARRLEMPTHPAALYTLTGPLGSVDPATGAVSGARPLYVVYIPFATAESTGLSAAPVQGAPWIMFPGTPKAHIMFSPEMR